MAAYVYLLHFDKPYWGKCRHYLGYTKLDVQERIAKHREGTGSKLVAYALQKKGCNFVLAAVWELPTAVEARALELRLKRNSHFEKICPVCKERGHG